MCVYLCVSKRINSSSGSTLWQTGVPVFFLVLIALSKKKFLNGGEYDIGWDYDVYSIKFLFLFF